MKIAIVVALFAIVVSLVFLEMVPLRTFEVPAAGAGILITGASSGIGRHAALALADLDFTVFAGVRKQSDADSLTAENPAIIPVLLDVSKQESIDAGVKQVLGQLEERKISLAGLVNNAGVSRELPVELQPLDTMRWVFEVNVFGVASLSQALIPTLRKAKGRIVNIGSIAGLIARPGKGTYSATKFALEGLNDAMRLELQKFGVSVSMVEPAFVKTKIGEKQLGENAPHKGLTESQYSLYAHLFDNMEARREAGEKKADTPEVTTEAIVHALTAEAPKTRYAVANFNGIPAPVVKAVVGVLPARIADMITLASV